MRSTIPDFIRAALMTNTDATVTTAGCPNPEKVSSGLIIPATVRINSPEMEINSYLILPSMNKKSVNPIIAKTIACCNI